MDFMDFGDSRWIRMVSIDSDDDYDDDEEKVDDVGVDDVGDDAEDWKNATVPESRKEKGGRKEEGNLELVLTRSTLGEVGGFYFD